MTAGAVPPARILPFGEAALLVSWGDEVSVEAAGRARALASAVDDLRARDSRWEAPVPAAASVLVAFDPVRLPPDEAAAALRALADTREGPVTDGSDAGVVAGGAGRIVELAVRFGGQDGPDLDGVARELGTDAAEVVRLLVGTPLPVLFLGFAPGFAYLGPLPDALVVPRLATPRARVPAGSVAIAGRFAGVYPSASPGGWRLLGRTDRRLFDPAASPPALLRPGDAVRLVPD